MYENKIKSKVNVAKKNTPSLKTTIPQGIASFLSLEPGDELEWKMQITDQQKTVLVSPIHVIENTNIQTQHKQETFVLANLEGNNIKTNQTLNENHSDDTLHHSKDLAKLQKFLNRNE